MMHNKICNDFVERWLHSENEALSKNNAIKYEWNWKKIDRELKKNVYARSLSNV